MNEQNNNVTSGVQQPNVTPITPLEQAQPSVAPEQPVMQQPTQINEVQNSVPAEPVQPTQSVEVVNEMNAAPQVQPAVNPEVQVAPVEIPVAASPVVNAETQVVAPAAVENVSVQPQPVQEVQVNDDVTQTPVINSELTPQVTPVVMENPTPVQQNQTQISQDDFGNPISEPMAQNNVVSGSTNEVDSIAFVANDAPLKNKKKTPIIIAVIVGVLVGLGLLGYFVIYPFIVRTYLSDPKNVYEATIKSFTNSITSTVSNNVKNKAIYDIELFLDTNIEELKSFSGYTYSGNFGVDPTLKTMQAGFAIKDKTTAGHSYYTYLKDSKEYVRYSTSRDLIYVGEADLESYNDLFNIVETVNPDDVNYLINKISELLIGSIDESKLTKEDASITINGESLKVLNHKYEINEETASKMVKAIINGIANDQKSLEILAKMSEKTADELKTELLETLKEEEEEASTEDSESTTEESKTILYTNIYTYGLKNDVVGFSLTNNKDTDEVTYYTGKDYFEFNIKSQELDEETNKNVNNDIQVVGITQTGRTIVTAKHNTKDVAKLTIKNWKESLYEFDYEIYAEEYNPKGTVKLAKDLNDSRLKYTLDFSIKMGQEDLNVSLSISEDWTSEVANINTGTAVTLDSAQLTEKQNEFTTALASTPIGTLIQTIAGFTSPGVEDYYNDDANMMVDPYSDDMTFEEVEVLP